VPRQFIVKAAAKFNVEAASGSASGIHSNADKDKFRVTQNGVKCRTLCKACNEWLGQEFDPVLNKVANDVGHRVG
jgi:hypothetical protein